MTTTSVNSVHTLTPTAESNFKNNLAMELANIYCNVLSKSAVLDDDMAARIFEKMFITLSELPERTLLNAVGHLAPR